MAINGEGCFVVENENHEINFTRLGDFKRTKNGEYINSNGEKLLIASFNENLSKIKISDLFPLNLKNISKAFLPTSSIKLSMNLDARENVLHGVEGKISFGTAHKDMIVPGNGLEFGNKITIKLNNDYEVVHNHLHDLKPEKLASEHNFTYGGFVESNDISGTIFGASTPAQIFSGATDGDSFTITCNGTTLTFTYTSFTPDEIAGEFNSLNTLAKAINAPNGSNLTARVHENHLYIAPRDASLAITFADKDGTFVNDLGLANTDSAANRFTTLEGLHHLINSTEELGAEFHNPNYNSSIEFFPTNPFAMMEINADASFKNAINLELGKVHGPAYDPLGEFADNFASQHATPSMQTSIKIIGQDGETHTLEFAFAKVEPNSWAVEVYAKHPEELSKSHINGLITEGLIKFSSEGQVEYVSDSLKELHIDWLEGNKESNLTLSFGEGNKFLYQYGYDYQVFDRKVDGVKAAGFFEACPNQNGIVEIDFMNGLHQNPFLIPLAECNADIANISLSQPGTNLLGEIVPGSVEEIIA
jgi:flagellar hook protein FlgE